MTTSNTFAATFLKSTKDFLIDHQQSLLNGVLVLVTISAESIFRLTSWDCPSVQPASRHYGICFIVGPAVVVLCLGLLINRLTWQLCQGCCCRHSNHYHGPYGATLGCIALVMKSMIAPIAWLFLVFLHANYYICIASTAPCDADSEENKFLKAESQIISWYILSVTIVTATLGLICYRCGSRASYFQSQFMTIYQGEEIEILETTMREKAKEKARENVNDFFARNNFSPKGWDCISMVPPHSLNCNDPKKCCYTSIERWAKEDCKKLSPPTPAPPAQNEA